MPTEKLVDYLAGIPENVTPTVDDLIYTSQSGVSKKLSLENLFGKAFELNITRSTNDQYSNGAYIEETSIYAGGTDSSLAGIICFAARTTDEDFGAMYGGYFYTYTSGSGTPQKTINNIRGLTGAVGVVGDNTTVGSAYGVYGQVGTAYAMTSVNITEMRGGSFGIFLGSGDIDVTTAYSLEVNTFTGGALTGSLGTLYGLYISDHSLIGFTTHYNIYSVGVNSRNRLEGVLEIGNNIVYDDGKKINMNISATYNATNWQYGLYYNQAATVDTGWNAFFGMDYHLSIGGTSVDAGQEIIGVCISVTSAMQDSYPYFRGFETNFNWQSGVADHKAIEINSNIAPGMFKDDEVDEYIGIDVNLSLGGNTYLSPVNSMKGMVLNLTIGNAAADKLSFTDSIYWLHISKTYWLYFDLPVTGSLYGIYIDDLSNAYWVLTGAIYNIYSAGTTAINKFEGRVWLNTSTSLREDPVNFGAGYMVLSGETEGYSGICFPAGADLYANCAEDGSGDWQPYISFGTAGGQPALSLTSSNIGRILLYPGLTWMSGGIKSSAEQINEGGIVHTSGSSTTVTGLASDFWKLEVGSRVTANSLTRFVVGKPDETTLIVDSAVDWDNGGAGYTFIAKVALLHLRVVPYTDPSNVYHRFVQPESGDIWLHNNYRTVDGANWERATFKWDSNVFKIITEAGGTGTVREIKLGISTYGIRVFPYGPYYNLQLTGYAIDLNPTTGAFVSSGNFGVSTNDTYMGYGTGVFFFGQASSVPTGISSDTVEMWAAQSDGNNALFFRVANTNAYPVIFGLNQIQLYNAYNWSSPPGNYERSYLKWNSNVFEIGTEAGGTGSNRDLALLTGAPTVNYIILSSKVRFNQDSYVAVGKKLDFYDFNSPEFSNYERASFKWDSSIFRIVTEAGGSGTRRELLLDAPYIRFGTYTALGTETLAGYITIKDAAGNTRKLAVIA